MSTKQLLLRIVAAVLLVSAFSVYAQPSVIISTSETEEVTFASELFGYTANVNWAMAHSTDRFGVIDVVVTFQEGTNVQASDQLGVHFTLTEGFMYTNRSTIGGQVEDSQLNSPAVMASHLTFRGLAAGDEPSIGLLPLGDMVEGTGRVRDNSVAFSVTGRALTATDKLTFRIPAIWRRQDPLDDFGRLVNSAAVDVMVTAIVNGQRVRLTGSSQRILVLQPRFRLVVRPLSAESNSSGLLSNNRTIVRTPGTANTSSAALIGLVSYDLLGTDIQGRHGNRLFNLTENDKIIITVSGNIATGGSNQDIVFVDLNGNLTQDAGEVLTVSGTNPREVPGRRLEIQGGTPAARNLNMGYREVYYTRSEDTFFSSTEFTLGMTIDFAYPGHRDKQVFASEKSVVGHLDTRPLGRVRVPNCQSTEPVRIYLTNISDRNTTVWMHGYDAEGENLGDSGYAQLTASSVRSSGSGSAELVPKETLLVQVNHLESAFGFDTDNCDATTNTWAGLANIDFFADGPVNVVPLLRTTDGVELSWPVLPPR